ncbi:hypothetical protein Nepgr_003109 [Nepenthes gracilis]|uniref:Glutaredoxin domain-containing protein n=1 Tax=Nepenthes gracilis TaxID=150966 RepID=A0AAD3RZ03_NEPGR|nr:hypothetical protein Nepgr_003109 [Nepenthes gracilis]
MNIFDNCPRGIDGPRLKPGGEGRFLKIQKPNAMGSVFSVRKKSEAEIKVALEQAENIVASTPAIVFSKTYCGYCNRVKTLFKQLGVTFQVVELDKENDGDAIQEALLQWTAQSTVPNVFIGGKHIGGCDTVMDLHRQGQLMPLLVEAKAMAHTSDQLA